MASEASRREAIFEACARAVHALGMSGAAGRIFAAILLSPVPLSQAQLRSDLSLSDGSVSEGLRLLREAGIVESSGDPRARPAYFRVREGSWADSAESTMENVRTTLALATLTVDYLDDYDIDGPSREWVAGLHAMYETLLAELPAVCAKAVEAGARAAAATKKEAAAS